MIRHFSILLLSVYFLGTLGLKINQHYCCGNLVSWEFLFGQQPKDCSGKVPVEKKKCCQDKVQVYQTDDSKPSDSFCSTGTQWIADPGLPFPAGFDFCFPVFQSLFFIRSLGKAPPEICSSLPVFLRFRNLRI